MSVCFVGLSDCNLQSQTHKCRQSLKLSTCMNLWKYVYNREKQYHFWLNIWCWSTFLIKDQILPTEYFPSKLRKCWKVMSEEHGLCAFTSSHPIFFYKMVQWWWWCTIWYTGTDSNVCVYRNHHFLFMAQVPWVEQDAPTCSSKCVQNKRKKRTFSYLWCLHDCWTNLLCCLFTLHCNVFALQEVWPITMLPLLFWYNFNRKNHWPVTRENY